MEHAVSRPDVESRADHEFPIAIAKTEFRDAWNDGDTARLRALLDAGFVDMSEGYPTQFGGEAHAALAARMEEIWSRYQVELAVIIIAIRISGDYACDYGWHKWTLTPKGGGGPQMIRTRYLELWRRTANGWKLANYSESGELLK